TRIRREMEELLRNELEEKKETTREEMRAEILAEARLAAKAELEDRLREERETLAVRPAGSGLWRHPCAAVVATSSRHRQLRPRRVFAHHFRLADGAVGRLPVVAR